MRKTIFAFSLILVAFLNAAPQKVERFLLVAGANNGGTDRVKLRYAESDANSFAGVMSQMGGVDRANVLRVFDPNAQAMQNGFAELEKRLQSKETGVRKEVIVYYSGHADEKGLRLGGDVYSWAEFRKNVNSIDADVKVAILDACGSGAITRTKGGVSRPAFMQDASSEMKGYAFLTSSNENEASQESDRIKGSFFTHALVGGLRGAADMTGNGKVTLSEAYQYAFDETLRNTQNTSAGSQHPNRDMNLAGTGDIVMTDLRETSAVLTLDSNLEGRLFIRDEQGNLFAELNKIRGRQIELGMPAGKYSVQMEAPSKIWMAKEVQISEGKKSVLSMGDMQSIEREKAVARGNADSTTMTGLDSARAKPFRLNINAVAYSKEPANELQIGLFFTNAQKALSGTQVSLIGNLAMDDMAGAQIPAVSVQVSAVMNIAAKNIYGIQLTSSFNYADSINGLQASSALNIAKNFYGAQAGIINFAGTGRGTQAGIMNLYADSLDGGQGGVMNIARNVSIGQGGVMNIAGDAGLVQGGVINVAGKVEILQGGVINIGGHVGRQIGIVNISAESDHTPIGLLNIVGNGIIDGTFYIDETSRTGIAMHLGTPYFYTVIEYALDPFNNPWPQSSGWGFGTRFGMWGNFFSLDYTFKNVYNENPFKDIDNPTKDNQLHKIRFGGAYKLLPGVALSSGLTFNTLFKHQGEDFYLEPRGGYHWHWKFGDHKARVWPGLYAGFTVGKF
ncbi:MAG: caspase family protein [Fibromonadaceae bacterium]|nr:caspase family protein [Fibromonadaceae bacterium]